MSALAASIKHWLLLQRGWVDSDALCMVFHVDPRELRATGPQPGLCSQFAISGPRGFKHVHNATEEEFQAFYNRMRAHGIHELKRAQTLLRARQTVKPQLDLAL